MPHCYCVKPILNQISNIICPWPIYQNIANTSVQFIQIIMLVMFGGALLLAATNAAIRRLPCVKMDDITFLLEASRIPVFHVVDLSYKSANFLIQFSSYF